MLVHLKDKAKIRIKKRWSQVLTYSKNMLKYVFAANDVIPTKPLVCFQLNNYRAFS